MEVLLQQLNHLNHWQIDLLATGLLLQGAVLTIFPEEVIISALGILWSQGRLNFFEALLAIQLGLLPANAALVFVGHHFGARALKKRPFSWVLKKEAVDDARAKLRKRGPLIVIITRFTPIIRGPVYFACGLGHLGVLRFMRIDGLTSFVQVPMWLIIGRMIGQNSKSLIEAYTRLGVGMGALFVILIVAFSFKKTRIVTS